ncbi:hypothetical protein ACB098_05G064300 [Castanea mollissima]
MSAGMNRSQGLSSLKRKQPDSKSPIESLTEHERILYNLIRSKQDMAIWTRDMKRETNIPDNVLNKSLKSLQAKKLIKEVVTIQNKGRKHYIATEFEPSKEITGGAWYVEGSLDTEFINFLKKHCVKIIYEQKIVTLEEILDTIRRSRAFNVEFTTQQIEEIVNALVLDNEILEVKSTGMGEFNSIPIGKVCYRCASKAGLKAEPKIGAMASIPCGVCPQISLCTPDGIISPTTCVYYTKWLHNLVPHNFVYEFKLLWLDTIKVSAKRNGYESALKTTKSLSLGTIEDIAIEEGFTQGVAKVGFEDPRSSACWEILQIMEDVEGRSGISFKPTTWWLRRQFMFHEQCPWTHLCET